MSGSGTHQCLLFPEILSLICGLLYTPTNDWLYPELAALTRTSRLFHDSAVQYLWSDMMGVSRLVKCMPDDLWKEVGFVPDTRIPRLELQRAIVPADWPRLKAYAQHVRVFRGVPANRGSEDLRIGDFQSLFVSVNCDNNFFPKLQTIYWNYTNSGFISVISMFLPPQIMNISFSTGDTHRSLELLLSLLITLPTRCPDIRMVTLTELKYETVSNGIEIVSSALQGWSNLSSLHLRKINPAAFYYLTTLQGLKDLVLDFGLTAPEVVDFKLEQLSPCSLWPFPSLDSLVLACPDANFCSKILRYLSCSLSLSSLNLTFGIASSLQWKTAVEKIKDTFPSLSSLTMRSTERDDLLEITDLTIGKEHFQPLYALQNLTTLEVTSVAFDLSNDALRAMGQAWPCLRKLSIVDLASEDEFENEEPDHEEPPDDEEMEEEDPEDDGSYGVTIAVLEDLLRLCPCLESLELIFDEVDSCPVGANQKISSSLRMLRVSTTLLKLATAPLVAAYISDVAPELERVTFKHGYNSAHKAWKEVRRLRRVFREVREQEMRRICSCKLHG